MDKIFSKIQRYEEKDEPSGVRYLYQSGIRYNDNEGLTFTSENKFYKPDFCISLKKWKWPKVNTVDFLVKISTHKSGSKSFLLFVMAENTLVRYREAFFNSQCTTRLINDLNGQTEAIIECYYDYLNQGEWRYYKTSPEKRKPSNFVYIIQQLEVITENITEEELKKHFLKTPFSPSIITNSKQNDQIKNKSINNQQSTNPSPNEDDIVYESPLKTEDSNNKLRKKRKLSEINDGSPDTEYITLKKSKLNPDEGSSPIISPFVWTE